MRGLSGKTALVTGGSSGLGEAIVYRLAEEGVSVAVGGRDEAKTRAVAERAAAPAGKDGHTVQAIVALGDVGTVAERGEGFERVADSHFDAGGELVQDLQVGGGRVGYDQQGQWGHVLTPYHDGCGI